MQVTAELRNWEFDYMYKIFFGDIVGDIKGRWPDGVRIHTSSVITVYKYDDHMLVVTRNSVYRLNKDARKGHDYRGKYELHSGEQEPEVPQDRPRVRERS